MVTAVVLALDSTPGKGIQAQTGIYSVFYHRSVVVSLMWLLLVVISNSHPVCLGRLADAMSFTNGHQPYLALCYLSGLLSLKDGKEKLLAQESLFFSLR